METRIELTLFGLFGDEKVVRQISPHQAVFMLVAWRRPVPSCSHWLRTERSSPSQSCCSSHLVAACRMGKHTVDVEMFIVAEGDAFGAFHGAGVGKGADDGTFGI